MKTRLLSLNSSRFWRIALSLAVCTIIAGPSISFAREHSSSTVGSATAANEASPPNPSPHDYQNYTCDQVAAEMNLAAQRLRSAQEILYVTVEMLRGPTSVCVGMGCLLTMPFAMAETHRRNQIVESIKERVRGAHKTLDVLENVAEEKACAVPMTAKITRWSKLAHEKAKSICSVAGLPDLVAVTENLEDYRVPCNFAIPLNVRCDSTGCQETAPSVEPAKATVAGNKKRVSKYPGGNLG